MSAFLTGLAIGAALGVVLGLCVALVLARHPRDRRPGYITDATFYPRALSDSEIAAIYEQWRS